MTEQIDRLPTAPDMTGDGKDGAEKAQPARPRRMSAIRRTWRRLARRFAAAMPTGLFGRSLIIIIAPMLLLQAIVAFVFMERHWQAVTNRLSAAVVRDISAIVDVIETYPQDTEY